MTAPCIIIGSSHAGIQLSLNVRQQGWTDDIIVISEDEHFPYQRPPLSKALLADNKTLDSILLKPETIYQNANVHLKLGKRVTNINRAEKYVELDNQEKISYAKLALCTGALVNKIPLPNSDLTGVHYLRDANDALTIQQSIGHIKNAVIIGGGFIGLETAASLKSHGINVTVIENQTRILQRIVSPEISTYLTQLHHNNGVTIKTSCAVEALQGSTKVEAVLCQNGERIPADMVVIGVGVTPNTELAEQSQLTTKHGIYINEFAQTNDPDIVAAGDCTSYFHEIYQRDIRVESIQNALEQAKSAAASINNKQIPFNANVPRFWSDQYNIKLQMCGLIEGYDQCEISQCDESGKLHALYLKNKVVIGAVAINNPAFLAKAQAATKAQATLTAEQISSLF